MGRSASTNAVNLFLLWVEGNVHHYVNKIYFVLDL
jgi:hypothetical protein